MATRKPEIADRIVMLTQDERFAVNQMAHGAIAMPEDAYLTSYELDLIDWAVMAGIAFALTRLEDPFECNRVVAERALPQAAAAYKAYSGGELLSDPQHWVEAHSTEA
jgi:hypothetical protein